MFPGVEANFHDGEYLKDIFCVGLVNVIQSAVGSGVEVGVVTGEVVGDGSGVVLVCPETGCAKENTDEEKNYGREIVSVCCRCSDREGITWCLRIR
ncbi:MAG: hypothetical protein UW62_C0024G0007 [Candidatus Collierbacteria bacterium GW2011_GWB1_44_35]|uniref:Uncharacterized protein n=1 Tax=Candidatus Collierbacteria bacterium GW2011_GWB1_44_35 TaxID=1618383 RepID=A0A0G1LFJ2_9BACT|nr:MAG: hypothetical protein UW62_C0024G0007 [Candidatus Collierbacteria bacterium GW2011_GWB1_44_35]